MNFRRVSVYFLPPPISTQGGSHIGSAIYEGLRSTVCLHYKCGPVERTMARLQLRAKSWGRAAWRARSLLLYFVLFLALRLSSR